MNDLNDTKWLANHFHVACPDTKNCGSSDAFCVDTNGHGKCFSCGKIFRNHLKVDGTEKVYTKPMTHDKPLTGEIRELIARGVTAETCRLFNYFTSTDGKKEFAQFPSGQKVRQLMPKKFFVVGDLGPDTLFGRAAFETSQDDTLVITEGEIDAMTAHQLFGVPAVSPIGGAKAMATAIQANLDFVKAFKKVVIAGDKDEPGRAAEKVLLSIIGGHCPVAILEYPNGRKDLNECYINGDEIEVVASFEKLEFKRFDKKSKYPEHTFVYVVADDNYEYLHFNEPTTMVQRSDIDAQLVRVCGMSQEAAKEEAIQLRLVNHASRCERRMALPHHKPGPHMVTGIKTLVRCSFTTPQPKPGRPTRLLRFFDEIFGDQLVHVMNWLSYYFKSCAALDMKPGQALYLAGDQGAGKNLFHDKILAALVGEGVDASMLINSDFNGLVFTAPYATIADKFAGLREAQRLALTAKVKDLVANNKVTINPKFGRQYIAGWNGRVILSLNLGSESASALPMAEPADRDKYSMIYCTRGEMVTRTSRDEWTRIVDEETPYLADYLLKWEVPPELCDNRFGVKAYHHPLLLAEVEERSPDRPYAKVIQDYLRASKQESISGSATELFDLVKRFDDRQPEHMRMLPLGMNVKGFGLKLTSLAQTHWWITKKRARGYTTYLVALDDKQIDIQ